MSIVIFMKKTQSVSPKETSSHSCRASTSRFMWWKEVFCLENQETSVKSPSRLRTLSTPNSSWISQSIKTITISLSSMMQFALMTNSPSNHQTNIFSLTLYKIHFGTPNYTSKPRQSPRTVEKLSSRQRMKSFLAFTSSYTIRNSSMLETFTPW